MTQPAKVQEPSMEEILASIRRIIADDEAKPPAIEKPAAPPPAPVKPAASAPPPRPAAMNDSPAPKVAPPPPAGAKPAPAPPPPAARNNQDDSDALLSGLDEATSPEEIRAASSDIEVLELTDAMAVPSPPPPQPAPFQKIEPEDDLEFTESPASR